MVLAVGQEMQIFSSPNLKDWAFESSFGEGYGAHGNVWECPDLFELPVEGTNEKKWVLLCSLGDGPFGDSATQYFIGSFDGKKFSCDNQPNETKWMDWGKRPLCYSDLERCPRQPPYRYCMDEQLAICK